MDSQWAGHLVDHMCKLLVQYALEADMEAISKREVKEGGEYKSAHANLEKSYQIMEQCFRSMQQS